MRSSTGASAAVRTGVMVVAAVLLAVLLAAVRTPSLASAAATLLSQGKPVTASSVESSAHTAAMAVDGSTTTRWSSARSDAQWLRVDLGARAAISSITLRWEAAYAKAYKLQVSSDATTWKTVASTTAGTGGVTTTKVAATGRYVRMLGVKRATQYGYSLWEFQVSGTPVAATPTPTPTRSAAPTTGVHVTGTQGHWQLAVDGKPYVVKGVTFGPANAQAATSMPDIAAMGANTVRTWGTDSSSGQLFDAAAANGLHVVAGLWLDQNADYATNTSYESSTLASIQATVTAYRSKPGLLMWDVGNEVMIGQSETERVAYAKYVEQVAKAIHAIDPNHPVTSTDAWTGAWAYYAKYAPDLDLYAVNTYNGISGVKQAWASGGYSKPYLVTETGPAGSWEVADDANGIPRQPTDTAAAQAYTNAWSDIVGDPGVALGATMFNYGTENDEPGVWLNLRTDGLKRLGYYAVERAYRGSATGNTPPVIQSLTLTPSTGAAPGSFIAVSAPATDPDGDPITYQVWETSKYIDGNAAMQQVSATSTGAGTLRISAPSTAGVWKIAVYALDGHGNVGIETGSVRVS
ncbi:discoidin domain-containing protein [Curtobacterium sp. MCBD17_040]|uniref:galactose-binding domain-containing protein n=1 Tax=Curtobacterium sp. MCBD17_040 TaxID=2175674 RepID=UPI000DA9F87E|nr:discoidin domain-containing protein [Curtobacterium sp. MCBD17_040]WIB63755.1 discoidin domain-containing protein [Curtobacterium sp. MCBD17_040]